MNSTATRSRRATRALDRVREPVSEQHAVREARQRVVQSQLGQPLVDLLLLADVLDLRDEVERRACLVAHQRNAQERPDVVAVGVPVALLDRIRLALAGEQRAHVVEVDVEILRMRERLERGLEQLLLAVAENAAERGVDAGEATVGRHERLADRGLVEGVAEALLRVPQLARRLALGGDVARDAEVAGERAVGPRGWP